MVGILGVRMPQNLHKGPRSVRVIAFRVKSFLLRSLVFKRNCSNDTVHGKVSFGS